MTQQLQRVARPFRWPDRPSPHQASPPHAAAHLLTVALLSATCSTACVSPGSESPPRDLLAVDQRPSQDPSGISVTRTSPASAAESIIFIGYRPDLEAQLQESLAGSEKDELWYRIHLPWSDMPSASIEKTYHFDTHQGLKLVVRMHLPFSNTWETLEFNSMGPGVSGTLILSGSDIIASKMAAQGITTTGNPCGVSLAMIYQGPLTGGQLTIPSGKLELSVGALYRTVP